MRGEWETGKVRTVVKKVFGEGIGFGTGLFSSSFGGVDNKRDRKC